MRNRLINPGIASYAAKILAIVCFGTAVSAAQAATFKYSAEFTLCTPTCNSFAALGGPGGATNATPSVVRGTVEIDVGLNDSFDSSDFGVYTMEVFNSTAVLAPFDGTNAASGNPLTLTNRVASVTGSGTTNANGNLDSGEIQFRFEIAPFNSNQAVVVFDLTNGSAKICILFDALGCIPGGTITATLEGGFGRLADAQVVGSPDVSGNAAAETVWVQRFNGLPIYSETRDTPAQTNVLGNAYWYNSTDAVPIKSILVPNADGMGNPGVAVMASNRSSDSTTRVEIHPVAGDDSAALLSTGFHGPVSVWRPLDIDHVPAYTAGPNGGIAVLAQNNADGRINVQVKNVEGTASTRIAFFNRNYTAIAMTAVEDISGAGPGIAVLAKAPGGGIKVQTRAIDNPNNVFNATYLNKDYTAINIVSLPDPTLARGFLSTHAVAVLARKFTGGTNRVQIRRVDGFLVDNIDFMTSGWTPFDVAVVNGASGPGSSDLAVLGIEAAYGRARVEVRSTAGMAAGSVVSKPIFLPADNTLPDTAFYLGLSLVVTPDVDGNGADEIGVYGRDNSLPDRLQLKDSRTGDFVRHIFPPNEPPPPPVYAQDFEGLAPADMAGNAALSDDGWKVFANVFAPDGTTYLYGYGTFVAPNTGAAFSAVASGEGGPEQGAQQLSIFSDYNNGDHAVGNRIEANVFQELTIGAGDVGKTLVFRFDAKKGNIELATTALAFIKTLNPMMGFATTNFITQDTTSLPDGWTSYSLSLTIDGSLVGQLLQIGFSSTASNYEGSGVFYDNIIFSE